MQKYSEIGCTEKPELLEFWHLSELLYFKIENISSVLSKNDLM